MLSGLINAPAVSVQPYGFTPDPTEATFLYVANNILRTKHYGAQTTRTGRLRNILVGIVLADGEITSNLRLTQAIYDVLKERNQINPPDPIQEEHILTAAQSVLPHLLKDDGVVFRLISGEQMAEVRQELLDNIENESRLKEILALANSQSNAYAAAYISKPKKAGTKA